MRQIGRMETAVSKFPAIAVLPSAVGVPVASGMAGMGVLVGVAFRLVIASAIGDGKICRCRPSTPASSRASRTVSSTLPVTNICVRQLLWGNVSWLMSCFCCRYEIYYPGLAVPA